MDLPRRLVLLAVLLASLAGCGDASKDAVPATAPPANDRFDKSADPAVKDKAGPKAS